MPDKLNDRHRLIAYMKLGGATRDQIATTLGYATNYVDAIVASPMFKALMDHMRAEMRSKTIGGVVDRIVAEGPRNLEVLMELRDHAESEQVRMTSARDLLDRNPETAKVSREDRHIENRIVIDAVALRRIAGVLEEDAPPVVIDVAPRAVHAAQAAGFQRLEEAVTELAAVEAEREA